MHHFEYKDGELYAEGVPISTIAAEVGTPFYVYSSATLVRHYQVFAEAMKACKATLCFAVKSNSNQAVLATLAAEGAGADVVSAGEMHRAIKAGVPADKIVFSGVGKTRREVTEALQAGIMQFNVESIPELHLINDVAADLGVMAPVSLRVNPDVDANTHEKITTGKKENKFGIAWHHAKETYAEAHGLPHIDAKGIAVHIGSQIEDLTPFENAFKRVVGLVKDLRAEGLSVTRVDLGGGLGIPYDIENPPSPAAYGAMVQHIFGDLDVELIYEPGRLISGNAGMLVSEVTYIKETDSKSFVIIDAAMNDLLRPSFYDAYHDIKTIKQGTNERQTVDVVGPICESSDVFGKDRSLPVVKAGDLVALGSAGAYGAVMSSTYNTRPLIPEVLVKGDNYALVRRRVPVEELIAMDSIPDWVKD